MAVQSRRSLRNPKPVELLALAYALGVAGTLWDWREHLLGPGTQPPHLLIDLGGLLVLAVLAFSGRMDFLSRSFTALYILLVLVVLISLGPFVLMMAAPRSSLMASLMSSMMSSRALLAYAPLVVLAGWSAWHWLSQTRVNWWRLAAALGIVVVAVATVWDLYWHQTHPMEVGASMAVLPPHQAILAGFLIGLVGAGYGVVAELRETTGIP
ncbi:MAG TPA: hypothetical protein VND96_08240 [Candidatus Micrarchaeaceae archaeon]|nr:hypothetical protein [Candidatus Micrarchaeaceae archaeon]